MQNKLTKASFLFVLLLGLLGKINFALAMEDPVEQTQLPSRIVTAGCGITEIMRELGLGDRIVGVSNSCPELPETQKITQIGYTQSLSTERVISLKPELFLVEKGAGPAEVLDQVQSFGVKIISYTQDDYTLDSWKSWVSAIGAEFNRLDDAQNLIDRVTSQVKRSKLRNKSKAKPAKALVLMSVNQQGLVAAGSNTVANLLLQLSGTANVAAGLEGYQILSHEFMETNPIDLLLVASNLSATLGGEEAICNLPSIQLATDEHCRLLVMPDSILITFGAHLDSAVNQILEFDLSE